MHRTAPPFKGGSSRAAARPRPKLTLYARSLALLLAWAHGLLGAAEEGIRSCIREGQALIQRNINGVSAWTLSGARFCWAEHAPAIACARPLHAHHTLSSTSTCARRTTLYHSVPARLQVAAARSLAGACRAARMVGSSSGWWWRAADDAERGLGPALCTTALRQWWCVHTLVLPFSEAAGCWLLVAAHAGN